jgi:hypothetical protein
MNGFALVLITATLGVDYGWQPSSDGRLEYIIQVEPVTLIALREGQEVLSQIDPYVRNVRRFRIRVGSDLVPRIGSPPREAGFGSTPTRPLPVQAGVTYGWQPVDAKSLEFIVQISPERLVLLKNGEEIVGEIPPEVQQVARFRVRSASGQLPRQLLASAGGQTSGVALASANQPPSTGQTSSSPPLTQSNSSPQNVGTSSSNTAWTANSAPQTGSGPALGSPPRLGYTGANADRTPAAAQGYTSGGAYSPSTNGPSTTSGQNTNSGASTYRWGTPTVNADQSDSRFIYEQTRGRFSESTSVPATQYARDGQGSGWQQPVVQPVEQPSFTPSLPTIRSTQPPAPTIADNGGSWATPAGKGSTPSSTADWPPRLRDNSSNGAATNQGGYGGWNSRPVEPGAQNAPAGQYAGSQYAGGQQAAGQHGSNQYAGTQYTGGPYGGGQYGGGQASSRDYLAPVGGPGYASNSNAPYVPPGQDPNLASRPPGAVGGGFSPYTSPGFQASGQQPLAGGPAITKAGNRGAGSDLEWPLNTVNFGVSAEKKPNPLDFWNELAATANDPSLAYLGDGGTSRAEEAWWPLTLAMLALFASMGGNLYMGWIAVDVYRKYLDVATDEYGDDDDYERPRRSRSDPRSRTDEDEAEGGWGDRRRRERTPVGSDYS